MRRRGQFIKYLGVGVFIVSVFMVASFVYISYTQDLSETTVIKSQAAYDQLGVTEEVLHAGCATYSRAVFNLTAVQDGDLSCITSDRTIRLSFTIETGGDPEIHNYSIQNGEVEEMSPGEALATGTEEVRTYPLVVRDGDSRYRGTVDMAVSGTGWQCRQVPGRCVDAGSGCARPASGVDCGSGRICCRVDGGGG